MSSICSYCAAIDAQLIYCAILYMLVATLKNETAIIHLFWVSALVLSSYNCGYCTHHCSLSGRSQPDHLRQHHLCPHWGGFIYCP